EEVLAPLDLHPGLLDVGPVDAARPQREELLAGVLRRRDRRLGQPQQRPEADDHEAHPEEDVRGHLPGAHRATAPVVQRQDAPLEVGFAVLPRASAAQARHLQCRAHQSVLHFWVALKYRKDAAARNRASITERAVASPYLPPRL